jgi:hypothetical protein
MVKKNEFGNIRIQTAAIMEHTHKSCRFIEAAYSPYVYNKYMCPKRKSNNGRTAIDYS